MANANGWGDGSVNNSIGWGKGAINNSIGWGSSQLTSWSGTTDIDGGNAPTNTVAPALSGTAQEGQTLTSSTGTWTGSPSYTYQWKRNGNNITSATNSTYILVTADVGQSIKCTVTATNILGSANADSNTVTPTSAVDPDAQAFITAASITNPTQQSAIITLVNDLKGYNIWTKMKAIYPIVGGTASSHAVNLKNPGTFNLTYATGWTHSSTGMTPNGATFAETSLNDLTNLAQNSAHCSIYSRSNNTGLVIAIGSNSYGQSGGTKLTLNFSNQTYYSIHSAAQPNRSNTDTRGMFIGNRITSTETSLMIRGSISTHFENSQTPSNSTFRIGGFPTAYDYKEYAFATIGDGLTNTDMSNLTTLVQAFQTTLLRQV